MFTDMLEYFSDFPTVTLRAYSGVTQLTSDARILTKYDFTETLSAHGFQKSAVQSYIRDKVFDDVDMVMILSVLPDKEDLIQHNSIWYSVAYPDNVGFADSVYIIGLKRVERPELLFYLVGDATSIVGDSTGVVGWKTYGL